MKRLKPWAVGSSAGLHTADIANRMGKLLALHSEYLKDRHIALVLLAPAEVNKRITENHRNYNRLVGHIHCYRAKESLVEQGEHLMLQFLLRQLAFRPERVYAHNFRLHVDHGGDDVLDDDF